MKADATAVRAVGAELEAMRAKAAELKARNHKMSDDALKEGTLTSADFIAKYEEAGKEYDGLRDEVSALDAHHKRLLEDMGEAPAPAAQLDGVQRVLGTVNQTPGQMFAESEQYKALKDQGNFEHGFRVGNMQPVEVLNRDHAIAMIKNVVTSDAGSAGPLLVPETRTGIIPLPLADLSILDLITVTGTDRDSVDFMLEKTWTSAAAETADNTELPESTIAFEKKTLQVVKIGHYIKITVEMAGDVPRLVGYIDSRMLYGVRRRLQTQVISGGGTGEDLLGLLNWTGLLSQTKGTDSFADAIHKAITKVRVGSEGMYEPTAVGIHPEDYETEVLTKVSDTDNRYVYGGPTVPGPRTMWGLIPVVHVGFPKGNPLVGDFSMAELAVRSGVATYMTDTDGDDFRYDRLAIKSTMRAAFGTNTPKAFCEVVTAS